MVLLPSERGKRIVFTGGSGQVGRHVITKLLGFNHKILNVDLNPLDNPDVYTLKADITDGAQTFNALSSHFNVSEPFMEPIQTPDAVIHFAGIPKPMVVPDNELFRINTMGSYQLIESACKLGIKKIILASSITTYGISYAEGNVDYTYFPVDESHPTEPMDVYGLSKVCMERTAASFSRRFKNVDIYVLRIGAVITPDNYEEKFKDYCDSPEKWKSHGWSYTDARDLGMMCHLAVQTDGLGFQIFNAVNDEMTNEDDAESFLKKMEPSTQIKSAMGKHDAPISNRKIREMLKFKEEFGWRRVLGKAKEK